MTQEIRNGFQANTPSVELRRKSVAEQMDTQDFEATAGQPPTHRITYVVCLQSVS
jgi:hypothetical protein